MLTQKYLDFPLRLPNSEPYRCRAAYWEAGSGLPLVMLHGFMGTGLCWAPLIQHLKPQFRCISVDLLGFGESSQPTIRYSIAVEVAFVRQVIAQLGLESCFLLGHSFGGWVAAAYALEYPQSVAGLILAAPAGIRDDSFCDRYQALRPLLWPSPLLDWGLRLALPLSALIGQRPALERIYGYRCALREQPVARAFISDRLRPEDAVDTVEKDLHQLRLPTLVISGDRDQTIPLWHSQTYAREIPGAQLAVIPEADHSLPQAYAVEMAALMVPFMAALEVA